MRPSREKKAVEEEESQKDTGAMVAMGVDGGVEGGVGAEKVAEENGVVPATESRIEI